jgi:flagellar basal-body rod protein FlgB
VLIDTTQLALERAIEGTTARNAALASNLANAETPGYQRVDVDFHGQLAAAMGAGEQAVQRVSFSAEPDATAQTRADGNSLDVDAESAKLAENALEHQAAVQVARARLNIIEIAIGRR